MITFKQINIKNCPYYLFHDMINIKNVDPNLFIKDKISFENTNSVIYNIKYINHVNIDSENPPYLIFNNADGYIEESNGNQYLIFSSRDKNKEVLKKVHITLE